MPVGAGASALDKRMKQRLQAAELEKLGAMRQKGRRIPASIGLGAWHTLSHDLGRASTQSLRNSATADQLPSSRAARADCHCRAMPLVNVPVPAATRIRGGTVI